jgi:hypothetical protein
MYMKKSNDTHHTHAASDTSVTPTYVELFLEDPKESMEQLKETTDGSHPFWHTPSVSELHAPLWLICALALWLLE